MSEEILTCKECKNTFREYEVEIHINSLWPTKSYWDCPSCKTRNE
jgi:hypothetical protein